MNEALSPHDHLPKHSSDRQAPQLKHTLQLLEDSISQIIDSHSFATYLRCMSRFHDYSFGNVMLILAQRPDATRVAGYRAWQTLGRQVRKGEHGIKILVPHLRRVLDPETNEGEASYHLVGYGVGTVFDISQTEGEPLPKPPVAVLLQGDGDLGRTLYRHLSTFAIEHGAHSVTRQHIWDTSNGYFRPDTTEIAVSDTLMADAATKTLAHEIAHFVAQHRLHDLKADIETVAESSAFVVLNHFGIDSGSYSFAYLARWSRDKDVLRRNLGAIQQTAQQIIAGVKRVMAEPPHTELVVFGEAVSRPPRALASAARS